MLAPVSPVTNPVTLYVGVKPVGAVVVPSYTLVTPVLVSVAVSVAGVTVAETVALVLIV